MTQEAPTGTVSVSFTADNWRCFARGEPQRGMVEAPLYTDAEFTGEDIRLGPNLVMNTLAFGSGSAIRAALVARVAFHVPEGPIDSTMRDDFQHYHGGDHLDELAALISLFLGIRIQAGSANRDFSHASDPLGRPVQYGQRPVPSIVSGFGSLQIPRTRGQRAVGGLSPLEGFVSRTAEQTNTLVKAARQYQQAVWAADSDPALAWLLLVSAVETAAVMWDSEAVPNEESLRLSLPELHALLVSETPSLLDRAATLLARITGSTRKFVGFLERFAPSPPQDRPKEFLRFDFGRDSLRRAARVIYKHRSSALHSGIGFPLPMCDPPRCFSFEGKADDAFQEVPLGGAMRARGATWERKQTPMLLHTFEYIARHALLNWWNSLEPSGSRG